MDEQDLRVGRVYRGKRKPTTFVALHEEVYNDRQVLWIGLGEVQYDAPSVRAGRNYPKIPKDKFLAWAGEDVTDRLPEGDWERVVRRAAQEKDNK